MAQIMMIVKAAILLALSERIIQVTIRHALAQMDIIIIMLKFVWNAITNGFICI